MYDVRKIEGAASLAVHNRRPSKKVMYEPNIDNEYDDDIYTKTCNAGIDFDKYDKVSVQVNIGDENEIAPINSFDDFNANALLKENLSKAKWTKPTPIQKYSIPITLSNYDLLGCAQTGSGKTAAFAIPIIQSLLENGNSKTQKMPTDNLPTISPKVLVTAPTRELVMQIAESALVPLYPLLPYLKIFLWAVGPEK